MKKLATGLGALVLAAGLSGTAKADEINLSLMGGDTGVHHLHEQFGISGEFVKTHDKRPDYKMGFKFAELDFSDHSAEGALFDAYASKYWAFADCFNLSAGVEGTHLAADAPGFGYSRNAIVPIAQAELVALVEDDDDFGIKLTFSANVHPFGFRYHKQATYGFGAEFEAGKVKSAMWGIYASIDTPFNKTGEIGTTGEVGIKFSIRP